MVIGRATANQMLPNHGAGRCGFVLIFTSPLEDEALPIFRVKGPEGSVVIPNHAEARIGMESSATAAGRMPTSAQALVLPAIEDLLTG